MHRVPERAATISFVQYTSDSTSQIHLLDTETRATELLVDTRSGGDFHAWTPDGLLLMADGSRLYQYDPEGPGGWQLVADLRPLRDITRLAVSPDGNQLALVAAEPPAE
jgi:Tol biopolymer transport system component